MRKLTVSAPGLSMADQLVLRSTLRLVSDRGWRHTTKEADADVRLVIAGNDPRAEAAANSRAIHRPMIVLLVPPRTAPLVTERALTLPLRGRDLRLQLSHLEDLLKKAPVSETAETPALRPAPGLTPVTPSALLDLLSDEVSLSKRVPVALQIGEQRIVIERDVDGRNPHGLRWRAAAALHLPALCRAIAAGAAMSVEAGTSDAVVLSAEPDRKGSLQQLVWAVAANDPAPANPSNAKDTTRFGLVRWPDFGVLPSLPMQLRLTAILSRRRLSAGQLAAHANASPTEVFAFLNACHWLRLLSTANEVEQGNSATAPQAAEPAPASPARERRPGLTTLLGSIRQALRLDFLGK